LEGGDAPAGAAQMISCLRRRRSDPERPTLERNRVPALPALSIAERLTFMAGCLPRTPFRDLVEAAAQAGFDSMTLWPNVWRHALGKEGLTLADMRAMLEHNGLVLTDVDSYGGWTPGAAPKVPVEEFFEVCTALGGSTLIAVHGGAALDVHRETEGFARLCDQAAARGLRVALEFVGFSPLCDVATAWKIVTGADRPNGGITLDVAHHMRSTRDDAALRAVDPAKAYTVQLCDGPDRAPADLSDEARYHRALPGTGDFNVRGFVRTLAAMGVRASVGPELYQSSFQSRPPLDVMRELMSATRKVLEV